MQSCFHRCEKVQCISIFMQFKTADHRCLYLFVGNSERLPQIAAWVLPVPCDQKPTTKNISTNHAGFFEICSKRSCRLQNPSRLSAWHSWSFFQRLGEQLCIICVDGLPHKHHSTHATMTHRTANPGKLLRLKSNDSNASFCPRRG